MFSLFYNLTLLLLAFFLLPKLLWQRLRLGKYRNTWKARLGFSLPDFTPQGPVIWIHSVSMGETRAIVPLFHQIRSSYPHTQIVISTTTETGQAEAKKSMPEAACHFLLPFDFSWCMRRLVTKIQPTRLILSEGDLWYHLLFFAKAQGASIALVNGKISERSCRGFSLIPWFSSRLLSLIGLFCLQSQRHFERFASLHVPKEKLHITGNLKLDTPLSQPLSQNRPSPPVLVIGSTHAPEEELLIPLLKALSEKLPSLTVFLVPRHPERFNAVAELLDEAQIPYSRFSTQIPARLILVDKMGILNDLYPIATLALVGGSYTPDVGGHNIFEPVQFGVPVLFGPHMHAQLDLKELILSAKAGLQVAPDVLLETLLSLLSNPTKRQPYIQACLALAQEARGATQKTFTCLFADKTPSL